MASGRLVDLLVMPDGALLVSDDKGGRYLPHLLRWLSTGPSGVQVALAGGKWPNGPRFRAVHWVPRISDDQPHSRALRRNAGIWT
jgi:hypothetical protein